MGYINYRLNFKHIRDQKFMTVEIHDDSKSAIQGHSRSRLKLYVLRILSDWALHVQKIWVLWNRETELKSDKGVIAREFLIRTIQKFRIFSVKEVTPGSFAVHLEQSLVAQGHKGAISNYFLVIVGGHSWVISGYLRSFWELTLIFC